jgi:hypothetical protein
MHDLHFWVCVALVCLWNDPKPFLGTRGARVHDVANSVRGS